MKAVARRILRLEEALTPQVDVVACLQAWDWATTLYERQRRCAEVNGLPFDQFSPERSHYIQQAGTRLTYARYYALPAQSERFGNSPNHRPHTPNCRK
jgi:hypothetical protein